MRTAAITSLLFVGFALEACQTQAPSRAPAAVQTPEAIVVPEAQPEYAEPVASSAPEPAHSDELELVPTTDAARSPSGLASRVLKAGKGGPRPTLSDKVRVHYTGWQEDGTQFDSSAEREPPVLPLSATIKGFAEGLQLMVVGEKRRLWIPADLAYGTEVRGGAPSGNLIFDVELLEILSRPEVPSDVQAAPSSAKRTASGLAYLVLTRGHGRQHPSATSRVTVHYSGWTTNGNMFDSSIERGTPASFTLTQVIKGWSEGVQLMVVGEKTRFWIPPDLAYGKMPRAGGPQGMLVFDIELLAID